MPDGNMEIILKAPIVLDLISIKHIKNLRLSGHEQKGSLPIRL